MNFQSGLQSNAIKIWIWLMQAGAMTGCHQMHERSLFFGGYQFPVCARCTGILLGFLTGMASFYFLRNANFQLLLLCTGFSVLILGIDGFFQLKGIWVSTNLRRITTGILCGFFITGLLIKIIDFLIMQIPK